MAVLQKILHDLENHTEDIKSPGGIDRTFAGGMDHHAPASKIDMRKLMTAERNFCNFIVHLRWTILPYNISSDITYGIV